MLSSGLSSHNDRLKIIRHRLMLMVKDLPYHVTRPRARAEHPEHIRRPQGDVIYELDVIHHSAETLNSQISLLILISSTRFARYLPTSSPSIILHGSEVHPPKPLAKTTKPTATMQRINMSPKATFCKGGENDTSSPDPRESWRITSLGVVPEIGY